MKEHKQVEIKNPWSKYLVSIDEGIAEMTELLWRLGMDTQCSCQEHDSGRGNMCLSMQSGDAERFLNIVASKREEETADLSSSINRRMREPSVPNSWCYSAHPFDPAQEVGECGKIVTGDPESPIVLIIHIGFPDSDYGPMVERLREAADRETCGMPSEAIGSN